MFLCILTESSPILFFVQSLFPAQSPNYPDLQS